MNTHRGLSEVEQSSTRLGAGKHLEPLRKLYRDGKYGTGKDSIGEVGTDYLATQKPLAKSLTPGAILFSDYLENPRPLDRSSVLPLFSGQPVDDISPMYFQLKFGKVNQRAVVQWPWKAWFNGKRGWSLQRLDRDWAETEDLKSAHPEQLKRLVEQYEGFDVEAQDEQ